MNSTFIARVATLCVILAVPTLILAVPALAHACPVCFQAKNDDNRLAFIITTLFLTVLPLLVIGTGVWVVRRRLIALEERDDAIGEPVE